LTRTFAPHFEKVSFTPGNGRWLALKDICHRCLTWGLRPNIALMPTSNFSSLILFCFRYEIKPPAPTFFVHRSSRRLPPAPCTNFCNGESPGREKRPSKTP